MDNEAKTKWGRNATADVESKPKAKAKVPAKKKATK